MRVRPRRHAGRRCDRATSASRHTNRVRAQGETRGDRGHRDRRVRPVVRSRRSQPAVRDAAQRHAVAASCHWYVSHGPAGAGAACALAIRAQLLNETRFAQSPARARAASSRRWRCSAFVSNIFRTGRDVNVWSFQSCAPRPAYTSVVTCIQMKQGLSSITGRTFDVRDAARPRGPAFSRSSLRLRVDAAPTSIAGRSPATPIHRRESAAQIPSKS